MTFITGGNVPPYLSSMRLSRIVHHHQFDFLASGSLYTLVDKKKNFNALE